MSFNKIILVGNLGRDPELRYTPQGTPVCSFSLATNERRKDKTGENNDITTWFRVTLWGRQAETASQYLQRGRPVYIEGRLRVEEWTDRDGKPRHTLEVNATDMQFIGGGARDEGGAAPRAEQQPLGSRTAARMQAPDVTTTTCRSALLATREVSWSRLLQFPTYPSAGVLRNGELAVPVEFELTDSASLEQSAASSSLLSRHEICARRPLVRR